MLPSPIKLVVSFVCAVTLSFIESAASTGNALAAQADLAEPADLTAPADLAEPTTLPDPATQTAAKPTAALPLKIMAAPILGRGASTSNGWSTYLVQLTNTSSVVLSGALHVTEAGGMWTAPGSPSERALARAVFSVAAGQSTMLKLPISSTLTHELSFIALHPSGKQLGKLTTSGSVPQPLLVDLTTSGRLAKGLDQRLLPTPFDQYVSATTPLVDPRTGDLPLPEQAAAYSAATLVLADSQRLLTLSQLELTALSGWVLAGGTLAIAITRPEDLINPVLARWAGGNVTTTPPHGELTTPMKVLPPLGHSTPGPSDSRGLADFNERQSLAAAEPLGPLVGYTGGNLRNSAWGAVASYGLGEVHWLAMNPDGPEFLGREWTGSRLLALVEHARSRQQYIALPLGVQNPDVWRYHNVRQALDLDAGNHWIIAISAVLLIVYALLAGPVNFSLARRKGKPLRALKQLPLWSAGAFVAILLLGALSKGSTGQARRLTFVEAGAGFARGAAVRFRAYYTASAQSLQVSATEQGNVLDVVNLNHPILRTLTVDRDGLHLEGFSSAPWETLLIREDGFINLGSGIAMQDHNGDVLVKNRTGRDLWGVIVAQPDGSLFYHPSLKDHESLHASAGTRVMTYVGSSFAPSRRNFDSFRYSQELAAVPGLSEAISAWQAVADRDPLDLWPSDVPVLLAQVDGGEGVLVDSGIPVSSDQLVLRVVGYGGEP